MVDAKLVDRMVVQIALGTPKDRFPGELDAEASALWDAIAADVEAVAGSGHPSDGPSALAGGESPMPWHVANDHPDCAGYAVVNEATDQVEEGGCHDTRAEADAHVAALYAAVPDAQAVPLDAPVVSGTGQPGQAGAWTGVLAVEGIPTRESPAREFAPGALEWAELPLPLRWRQEDSHGGVDMGGGVVLIGRIDRVWREAAKVMGSGVLDLDGVNGQEAHRLMGAGMLRGVSIDADDIADADVELVWGDGGEPADADDPLGELLGTPEMLRFHHGRVRAATLVDLPAFAEATVALTSPVTAAAAAEWDGAAAYARCSSSATPAACFRGICAARVSANPADTQAGWALPHHNTPDGPAVPAGVSAALARVDQTDGIDRAAARRHLQAHQSASARARARVAAANLAAPPADWFANPRLTRPTPITVTDELRVYGHPATWDRCHIGIADACVQAPREDDHPFYLIGEVVTAEGTRVPVGQITLGTGHADTSLAARPAAEHYDHTGTAVADVTCGNDAHGIWVAGAIRPSATPEQVHALRASGRVSGDWRMIGGRLRLVALLAVNVGGFPVTRARVASGRVLTLVGALGELPAPADARAAALRALANRIARDVGLDTEGRRAAAVARVHGRG